MSKAPILFYYKNTKPVYPPLVNEFSEETIYRAFITYCKFNSGLPIEPELQSICLEKPDVFDVKDSIQEKIEKLKELESGMVNRNYKSFSVLSINETLLNISCHIKYQVILKNFAQ